MPTEPLDPAQHDRSPHNPPPDDSDGTAERLDRLEVALDDVRARLERIRAQLGSEVRTERLVILEGDGFERMVLDAAGHFGGMTVRARGRSAGTVAVEVFAADAHDGDRAHVGLALLDDGEVVAAVDVQSGRPAAIWAPAPDDQRPRPG